LTAIRITVDLFDLLYIQFVYHIGDEMSKMITGKPFTKRRGEKKELVLIV
jgi:hypothetical protein